MLDSLVISERSQSASQHSRIWVMLSMLLVLMVLAVWNMQPVMAQTSSTTSSSTTSSTSGGTQVGLGAVATNLTGQLPAFVKLIISGCYVAGLALAGAAILKFKAHKDNPTQVPLGTPIALLFIGAALLWLPSVIQSTGQSMFGGTAQQELTGPGGSSWTNS